MILQRRWAPLFFLVLMSGMRNCLHAMYPARPVRICLDLMHPHDPAHIRTAYSQDVALDEFWYPLDIAEAGLAVRISNSHQGHIHATLALYDAPTNGYIEIINFNMGDDEREIYRGQIPTYAGLIRFIVDAR